MAVTHTEPLQSPEFRLATQMMAALEFVLDLDLFKEDLDLSVAYNSVTEPVRIYSPITMLVVMDEATAKHIPPGSRLSSVYMDLRITVEPATGTVQWGLSGFLFEGSGRVLNRVIYIGTVPGSDQDPSKEAMLTESVLQELRRAALHHVHELVRLLMATLIAE